MTRKHRKMMKGRQVAWFIYDHYKVSAEQGQLLDFEDIISWLPHGRSFRVLQPKAFEERVIPLFFRHGRYASFARQVNGWGFKRVCNGPDYGAYYHEVSVLRVLIFVLIFSWLAIHGVHIPWLVCACI